MSNDNKKPLDMFYVIFAILVFIESIIVILVNKGVI